MIKESECSISRAVFYYLAMRVYIKWKLVIPILLLATVFFVLLYQVFAGEKCQISENLNIYCNNPFLPEQGSEGDVPFNQFKLTSLHIITRHGDRSPIHVLDARDIPVKSFRCFFDELHRRTMPIVVDFEDKMKEQKEVMRSKNLKHYSHFSLYPDSKICSSGTLTPRGSSQLIRNGLFLQGKYRKHKLFDREDFEKDFKIVTTLFSRTFQTALSFLYGFLPRFDMSKIEFETASQAGMCRDKPMGLKCNCPATVGAENTFSSTFEQSWSSQFTRPENLYSRVSKRFRFDSSKPNPRPSHVYDFLVTHYCHNRTIVDSCLLDEIFNHVQSHGVRSSRNIRYVELASLKLLPLMVEISRKMIEATKAPPSNDKERGPFFVLYSGHDSTVEPLATALGFGMGYWPKYASRIVIEQYREISTKKDFVRVLSDGVPVTHQSFFCRESEGFVDHSLCPLENFINFVNMKARDYRTSCYRNSGRKDGERLPPDVTEKIH